MLDFRFKCLIFSLVLLPLTVQSQEFVWPTNASHFLTSSFAEYRPGHFHAGIDIKTWNREGYKVFAIQDGYIWRIRVSPYGYGRALYQKLNSGEIIIYGHLQKFNPELEAIVKQEQHRNGVYRVNKYLSPTTFPVKKGDIIAYTGSTGAGPAHLHFEVRDANNQPMNPFLLGYKIKDTVPPGVSGLCFTPLDARARVNSDVRYAIYQPRQIAKGKYHVKETPLLSGRIGFAVDCWDKANGVNNVFAVYRIYFYVDGELRYSAVYNKFSYDVSSLIDLDRDYRLNKRGEGLFQKLYKDVGNNLPFYRPMKSGSGILWCDVDGDQNRTHANQLQGRGPHTYLIELYDFNGNLTTVQGQFYIGRQRPMEVVFEKEEPGRFLVTDLLDGYGMPVQRFKIYRSWNNGRNWQRYKSVHQAGADLEQELPIIELKKPVEIIKIVGRDTANMPAFPSFHVLTSEKLPQSPVDFSMAKDFYDDYIRIDLTVNGLIRSTPRMYVQQIGVRPKEVELVQYEFNHFCGVYQLLPYKDGPVDIEVYARDMSGKELMFWDQFNVTTISPGRGGQLISKDQKCQVRFERQGVYKTLFARLSKYPADKDTSAYDMVGGVYEMNPFDVPLKKRVTVSLAIPPDDPLPEKLGVYSKDRHKKRSDWGFAGNVLDREAYRMSARISSLRQVTLIRDMDPPEIQFYYPKQRARITRRYPTLRAMVRDKLSGFNDERSIVMKLDGRKVIAEYDPEKRLIKYRVDEALGVGEHTVTVTAVDNCGNKNSVTQIFTVVSQ